jgi:hypothetical protein
MLADRERTQAIELVLMAVLRQSQKPISSGDLKPHPRTNLRL